MNRGRDAGRDGEREVDRAKRRDEGTAQRVILIGVKCRGK